MPGVDTHKMERSLRALTVGTKKAYDDIAATRTEIASGEYVQQAKVPISGVARSLMEWIEVTVTFPEPFIPGGSRTRSDFKTPFFTFGYMIESREPVVVTAHISAWVGDEDETTGAEVRVGVWHGDGDPNNLEAIKFKGEAHLAFQGFAYPVIEDDDG